MASRNRIDTLRVEDEQKTKIVFFMLLYKKKYTKAYILDKLWYIIILHFLNFDGYS